MRSDSALLLNGSAKLVTKSCAVGLDRVTALNAVKLRNPPRIRRLHLMRRMLRASSALTRAGNEQCPWFGKHVFVFVELFGVWLLNMFRFVFGYVWCAVLGHC